MYNYYMDEYDWIEPVKRIIRPTPKAINMKQQWKKRRASGKKKK